MFFVRFLPSWMREQIHDPKHWSGLTVERGGQVKSSSCLERILIKNRGRCCVHREWYIVAPLLSELKRRPLFYFLKFVLILCLLYRISLFPCQLCLSVSLPKESCRFIAVYVYYNIIRLPAQFSARKLFSFLGFESIAQSQSGGF
jgi:hypothetical protein